jgi:hypothetical protein
MRLFKFLALSLCLIVLAACASARGTQADKLQRMQYAWSGAIRWSDFESAQGLMDPKLRDAHRLSDAELERYKQVQISFYRDNNAQADMEGGTAARDVEIGVINRHTMAERTVRYRETWRWDFETKTWWVTSRLPDLWQGQ